MLDRVQGNTGTNYFTQAVSEYKKNMCPWEKEKKNSDKKTIDAFSEKEWDRLLNKVDQAIEEYKADLKERKEDSEEQKKEQTEDYILGKSFWQKQEYERTAVENGRIYARRFQKVNGTSAEKAAKEYEKLEIIDTISDELEDELIQKIIGNRNAPYSTLADENGMVIYNDVIFQCDYEKNRICLGDVSDPSQCLSIPLEKGGSLVVNRDSIGMLSKAIGMFSPEDINRIMRAIAQDAKVRQTEQQIEDETSGLEVLGQEEDGENESKE
ncbi:MAG: hypothetical protein HFH41_12575 [Lachnospiraceae bacterium]|nr:hypothetical protein [Lachnospiraceae bacterium]